MKLGIRATRELRARILRRLPGRRPPRHQPQPYGWMCEARRICQCPGSTVRVLKLQVASLHSRRFPHFIGFRKSAAKEAKGTRTENNRCKSFWRLKFRKEEARQFFNCS